MTSEVIGSRKGTRYNPAMPSTSAAPGGFGSLLRQWRSARRMSQQQLAVESEVSTRHISYVENGRSSPSRQMVLILASALDLPLRERNALLSAAGFAPVYRESDLSGPEMLPVRRAFDAILAHHEPYPAIVLTRTWDIVSMNKAFGRLFAFFIVPPFDPIVGQNVMHSLFHPGGVRPYVANWEEVATFLIDRLYRESIVELETSESRRLLEALLAYPGVPSRLHEVDLAKAPRVCVTVDLEKDDTKLVLFSTLTTLGTPLDVTAQELRIESYFPADEATADWLRKSAASTAN
jgi:transcriptional regulator with XRE-family HTH domain